MKEKITLRVAASLLKRIAIFSLWFLGIGGLVMAFVAFILLRAAEDVDAAGIISAMGVALNGFCPLATLITGIVYPLVYVRLYLSAGVTRRQFAVGFMLAGCGYAVALAALYSLATAINGAFAAENLALTLASSILAFCAGWAAAMGFQIRMPVLYGAIGILCAIALRGVPEVLRAVLGFSNMETAGLALGLAVVTWTVLLAASRRIVVKC